MSGTGSDILIVGIGGAAIGFATRAAALAPGARLACFDSDGASEEAAQQSFFLMGAARCSGRGCGGDAVKARAAAIDDIAAVRDAVTGTRLAIVAVALGGGFGSGAAPEILKALRDEGITAICVATTPFAFEGGDRAAAARRALPLLESAATATAVISLDDLFAGGGDAPLADAYAAASGTMSDVLTLFWRLAAKPGFITIGAERISAIASSSSGKMRISTANATGEGRATAAANALLASRLPGREVRLENAEAAIVGVLAGSDLRLAELTEISTALSARLSPTCHLDFGVILDEEAQGALSIVCLFFEKGGAAEADDVGGGEPAKAQGTTSERSGRGRRAKSRDPLASSSSGARFKGTEGTIYNGQNLDIPTYQRRNLPLEK